MHSYAAVDYELNVRQKLHLIKNFIAGGGNDTMGGSDRSDNLWGGTGNDTLYGYPGDDKIYGEEGDDILQGQDGNDLLDGGVGNDGLVGGSGDDVLWGGDGNDELYGNEGHDKLMGQTGHDQLLGQEDDDHLWGGEGDDELQGGEGHDILMGETGNDRLFGQVGNDILLGGDGDDLLVGFTADNEAKQSLAVGESDDDILSGGNGNDRLYGGVGDDQLMGDAGDDLLLGQEGNDRLWGGDGKDELQGGEGNDQLDGGSGNDKLFGQVGNDTLRGGDGDDVLVGFTMSNESKQNLDMGETDDDILSAGNGNDNLYGGVGNDQLLGDAGDDLLLGEDGHDQLWGDEGKDELQGGDGNDQLDGGAGDDRLFGQLGNDTLYGGAGNDLLLGFTASNEAKQSLSTGETDDDILHGGAGSDILIGGLGNDELYGGADRDELQGGEGNDLLFGEAGNDNLFGQVGNDILYGGDGDDYLQGFTASNEAKQTLAAGESDDDFLYGGAGNDTLVGGVGNDYLDGGAGADIMIGGKGDDVYIVNSVNDTIYEKASEGYDTVITSSNYLLNANIEELRLLEGFNIHGTGNALNNKIIGNSADNILDGVTGADTLIGGVGNDTYYVDNVGDTVIEFDSEGTDSVQSSISYTLGEHVENLVLLDFAKPEKGLVDGKAVLVYGYPKRNELDYMQGDAVENYEGTCALTSIANLLTQAGQPTTESQVVNLAINNNWAIIDRSLPAHQLGGSNINDQRNILNNYGLRNDIVMGYNETGLAHLLRSGRGVILAVNAGALWGDSAYIGNGVVNHAVTLTGAVYGEADGMLVGFYLTDSGRGKVSDMTRFVDIATFRNMANVPNAYALYTIEPVKYWQENINGTGNALDNHIAGNRGDNILSGMAGNDVIKGEGGDDALYGGTGNDTLHGGTGNDLLYGGSGDDVYHFNMGDGNDIINDSEGNDTLIFGPGITARDVQVELKNGYFRFSTGHDSISMQISEGKLIKQVRFADGITWLARADGSGYSIGPSDYCTLVRGAVDDILEVRSGTDFGMVKLRGCSGQYELLGDPRVEARLNGPQGTTVLRNVKQLEFVDGTLHFSADAAVARIGRLYRTALGRMGEPLSVKCHANLLVNENKTLEMIAQDALDSEEYQQRYGRPDDSAFIRLLYMNALKREADPVGYANHLHDLQNRMSRAQMLVHFSESEELIWKDMPVTATGIWDMDEITASVTRFYIGVLGRTPDATGLVHSSTLVQENKVSLLDVVAYGLISPEFQSRHGSLDDTQLITLLYRQALNREPYAAELQSNLNALSSGKQRAEIAMTIINSSECRNYTIPLIKHGIAVNDRLKGTVRDDVLDGLGLAHEWVGGLGNDTYSFGRGYGANTLIENDATPNNQDQVRIQAGVQAAQLWFQRQGNDLALAIIGSTDTLLIKDHYLDASHQIEQFKLHDGMMA